MQWPRKAWKGQKARRHTRQRKPFVLLNALAESQVSLYNELCDLAWQLNE